MAGGSGGWWEVRVEKSVQPEESEACTFSVWTIPKLQRLKVPCQAYMPAVLMSGPLFLTQSYFLNGTSYFLSEYFMGLLRPTRNDKYHSNLILQLSFELAVFFLFFFYFCFQNDCLYLNIYF
jgi:hypothetical protein